MSIRLASRWFVVSLSALVGSLVLAGDDPHPLLAQVDQLFAACNRTDVPGCAVGIIQNGKLIYSQGFGSANLAYGAPNTPTTLFEIASASKGFTSACIALLMDEGKLRPDDDVRQIIPELRNLEHPIRIRHMLRCETGLWEQFHIMPLVGYDNVPIHTAYSKADLFTVLTGQRKLPFEPGMEFQYGSGEFFLLGIVIERVTGKTLAQFARERLFQPLGMTRTDYEEDPGLMVPNRAVGHWKGDEGWSSQDAPAQSAWRLWQANSYAAGGGGVRTCIEDLHRWDQAFDSDVLPRGEYLREFLTHGTVLGNRIVVDADAYKKRENPQPDNPPPGQYRGLKRIQFTGGFWGMATSIARFPDEKFTVICLSNSSEVSPFARTREIADLFLADRLEPVAKAAEDKAEPVELPIAALQALTGAFRAQKNAPVWRTEVREGRLMLVDHLDHAFALQPLSATRFQPVGETPFYPSARFEFTADADGRAKGLTLSSYEHGFHERIRFDRVELAQPATAELSNCAGIYESDELAATYRFKVEDDALWLRVNSRRWERLRPLTRDEFTPDRRDPHDQRFIRFSRGDDGTITGLTVTFWRIRGVRFEKRIDG
ncbi:MAG TPA: serine hydrolase [Planctomycetaceae bacterium]|nr:serine hydrolase [Planctomycetaceae bacterium]